MGEFDSQPGRARLMAAGVVATFVVIAGSFVIGPVAWALDEATPSPSPSPSGSDEPEPTQTPTPSPSTPTPSTSAPHSPTPGDPSTSPPKDPSDGAPGEGDPQVDQWSDEGKRTERPGTQDNRGRGRGDEGATAGNGANPYAIDVKRDSLRTATTKARLAAAAAQEAQALYRAVSREEQRTEVALRTAQRSQVQADIARQHAVRLINASPDAGALVADPRAATLIAAVEISTAESYLQGSATLTGFSESLRSDLDQASTSVATLEAAQVAALARQQEARQALLDARATERVADRAVRQAKEVFLRLVKTKPSAQEAWWMRQYASSGLGVELAAMTSGRRMSLDFAPPADGVVTSPFGMRKHPILDSRRLHSGADFAGGSAVRAGASGTVVRAAFDVAYGNYVVVLHGQNAGRSVATLYAHCASLDVAMGDRVRTGEVLGQIGDTGYSTGLHLHFELRLDGRPVDPLPYIR